MSISDLNERPVEQPVEQTVSADERIGEEPAPSRVRRILWIVLGVLLALSVVAFMLWRLRPPELHGVVLQSPDKTTDFTLTASTGESMSLSDLEGKFVLLFFGYTFCPDVCPTTLADMSKMADALGDKKMEDVEVVFISVDPERDTPERMDGYLDFFDERFLGMTGTLEDIIAAGTQFGVFFERHEGTPATGYLVDHTSTVTLIDPDGYVRMVFPYGTAGEDIAADVEYMMRRIR